MTESRGERLCLSRRAFLLSVGTAVGLLALGGPSEVFGQGAAPALAQVVRPLATPRAAATARPTITVRYPTPTPTGLPVTSGLQMWFDAGTQCDGVGDGVAQSSWTDLSGNARHVVQASGTLQPTCQTAVGDLVNGLPVIDFDGTDDYLRLAFGSLAQSTTIFVVADSDDQDGNSFYFDGVASREAIYWRVTGQRAFFAGAEIDTSTNGQPAANTMASIVVDFDGASSAEWLDGTANGTGNPGSAALTGITLGNSSGLSGPWNGQYAMVLVYAPKLSTGDRQLVEAYISTRWGTP